MRPTKEILMQIREMDRVAAIKATVMAMAQKIAAVVVIVVAVAAVVAPAAVAAAAAAVGQARIREVILVVAVEAAGAVAVLVVALAAVMINQEVNRVVKGSVYLRVNLGRDLLIIPELWRIGSSYRLMTTLITKMKTSKRSSNLVGQLVA